MISAKEAKKELDEIEQLITMQLQGIDRNFAKCCELLTNRILTDVNQYGVHTNAILEAFEIWYEFFSIFEIVGSDVDPSIADYTSITNRPPLYDHTRGSASDVNRNTAWNRRKRSSELTPETRLGLHNKRYQLTNLLSDTSSSTNQTEHLLYYSPPQTIPFGVSHNKIAGTPMSEQARIINDNNIKAMSMGLLDSDPSDEIQPPQLKSAEPRRRRVYHDPKVFSSAERIAEVMSKPSSTSMGFASPINRSTRAISIFKRPRVYNNTIDNIGNSSDNNNNNNNDSNTDSRINTNNNNIKNSNNNNTWNDNILDVDVPEERERFKQFFWGRQRRSEEFNDELPIYRNLVSSPTKSNTSRSAVPQSLVGSPTILRVFDKKETDLRRLMTMRGRENTQENINEDISEGSLEKENSEPIVPTQKTPERSTITREAFESPLMLRDDTPMRITQELDRFSPMRINPIEDIQQTPEAVPLFAQNLTYRPSPREVTSETSNDTTSSNITMIRGESGGNIPAKFSLKYFTDTFRTPPGSTQLTRVFNLFSDRPGQMLAVDDVLRLLNDSAFKKDNVELLIDVLKRKKFLKRVGDGQAWTIRR